MKTSVDHHNTAQPSPPLCVQPTRMAETDQEVTRILETFCRENEVPFLGVVSSPLSQEQPLILNRQNEKVDKVQKEEDKAKAHQ